MSPRDVSYRGYRSDLSLDACSWPRYTYPEAGTEDGLDSRDAESLHFIEVSSSPSGEANDLEAEVNEHPNLELLEVTKNPVIDEIQASEPSHNDGASIISLCRTESPGAKRLRMPRYMDSFYEVECGHRRRSGSESQGAPDCDRRRLQSHDSDDSTTQTAFGCRERTDTQACNEDFGREYHEDVSATSLKIVDSGVSMIDLERDYYLENASIVVIGHKSPSPSIMSAPSSPLPSRAQTFIDHLAPKPYNKIFGSVSHPHTRIPLSALARKKSKGSIVVKAVRIWSTAKAAARRSKATSTAK